MVALPIAKLASLAIKTLAKPMSKQVKQYFTKTPLSQQFLVVIGQTTHNITTRLTIWSAGYRVRSIPKLDTEAAVKQGADFIGEFFIFSVAGGLVVWEYDKSKKKEVKKDEATKQSVLDVRADLDKKLDKLQEKINKLEEVIVAMNKNIDKNNHNEDQQQQSETKDTQTTKRQTGWFW